MRFINNTKQLQLVTFGGNTEAIKPGQIVTGEKYLRYASVLNRLPEPQVAQPVAKVTEPAKVEEVKPVVEATIEKEVAKVEEAKVVEPVVAPRTRTRRQPIIDEVKTTSDVIGEVVEQKDVIGE